MTINKSANKIEEQDSARPFAPLLIMLGYDEMEEPLVLHEVEAQVWFRSLAFDAHLALSGTTVSAALVSSQFAL